MTKELEIFPDKSVNFYLYGLTEASVDGVRVGLGAERERCMVARLLLAEGQAVSRLELMEHMWDDPPDSAPDILNHAMTKFRSWLATVGLKKALVNRDGLCRLTIAPDQVDARQLAALVAKAKNLDTRTATERLHEQLARCMGEPLAGLTNHRLDGYRRTLLEQRRNAEIMLFRIDFRLGRAEKHVPTLARLCQERQEDTDIAGLTMYALHATGRQAEALAVYKRHGEYLVKLGMEMPVRMQNLYARILNNDTGLGPEQTDFPFGDNSSAAEEAPEKPKTGKDSPQVVTKISGKVRGDYIVFGVDNRRAQ